jgi:basic membrane protein A
MKRILTLVLMLSLVVSSLAGCGASNDTAASTAPADSAATSETTATETPTESVKVYKVAMITDSSIADGGWGAACYNAMLAAADREGFETQYTDGVANADFASTIRSYCDLGFDLIFAPGNQYSDAVAEVSKDYPDVYFALLNGTLESDNVTSLLPDAKQIGLLAGALAGLMSDTESIGFIGGLELDTTKAKLAYYTKGAQAVNPNIVVTSAYAGSFSDTAKGKEIANTMVTTNDVDVMFGDASAVDSGAREILATFENRYDIGQPSDLLATQESDIILNSVVTDNATMVQLCMQDILNGTYGNKTIYGNLENGGLSVGTFGAVVPEDVQAEYLDIVESIKAGTFVTE